MRISVVIPAYNEEHYLPKTLNSLSRLQRKPDEIIIVDGSSTDKTFAVARAFGATVVIIPHRGIGLARQQGLEQTTGDVVAYTDADTIVPSDWLTKIENIFSTTSVVGVFGTFRTPSSPWWYQFHNQYTQDILTTALFRLGFPMSAGQNLAFRRNAGIKAGGFPVGFRMVEDIEIMRRLMKRGRVLFRPDIVVYSSGRRAKEGIRLPIRYFAALFLYIAFGRGDLIGFTDYR
jgi:peptidoglycan-N-acetylglucosamine deacetylase